MPSKNPFTPTFGRVPLLMAGRGDIVAEIEDAFVNGPGDPGLSTIFTGARGTGKTALLVYLSRVAGQHGWIAVNTSAIEGMLEDIIEQTRKAAGQFIDASDSPRLKGLTVGQLFGFELDNPERDRANWRSRMTAMLEALNSQDIGLLITVDEVTPDLAEMVELAAVYQHFVGEERKVALLLAGLPGKVLSLLRNESVSFLRRANRIHLDLIDDDEVAAAMRDTIEESGRAIYADALGAAVEASEGFPYLMQLVGFQSWAQSSDDAITLEDVRAGAERAQRNFAERVLDATYYDLSQGDIRFLQAMLEDENESRLADIARRLDETSGYASTYKKRLIEQGIIGERGVSYVVFELPGFRAYLEDKVGHLS